jgi:hypothetical protein
MRFLTILMMTILATASLGACGIKPDFVDPPQTTAPDNFPRTYPSE